MRIFWLLAGLILFVGGCTSGANLYKEKMMSATAGSTDAVRVTWMGTAGLYVTDGESSFFIDPFVSRYGLFKVICGFSLSPQTDKVDDWIDRVGDCHADAVIVTHSHYDHAMDAPFFAQKTGALLVGSESAAMIGKGAGLAENQIKVAHSKDRLKIGKFEIVFIESRHSKAVLGRIPWQGKITQPLIPPAAASDYRLGEVFALWVTHPKGSFVHLGSAGFIEGMFGGMSAQTLFLSIAGREDTRELLNCTAMALGVRQIIPIHFDDFFRPVDKEISILRTADMPEFYKTVSQEMPGITVDTLPLGGQTVLFP